MLVLGQPARSIATWLLVVLLLVSADAQNTASKLDQLANDVEQALAAQKPEHRSPQMGMADSSRTWVTTLRAAIARGELTQIQAILEQLAASLESDTLRERCLQAAAEARTQREAKEKETADDIAATLKRAGDVVRTATKPAELDPVLQELGKLRTLRQELQSSSALSSSISQVEPAIQFVTSWQNYLAQRTASDGKAAQESLDRIINMTQVVLLPRSEILARRYGNLNPAPASPTATPKPDQEFEFELKTPNDLLPASEKLAALLTAPGRLSQTDRPEVQRLHQSVTALSNAYQEFMAGLPTRLDVMMPDDARYDQYIAITAPVRAQLIKLMLPRYLGLPAGFTAKPEEGTQEFLQRIISDALAKKDFVLAAHAREAQLLLRDGRNARTAENSQSSLFITARNQETAGQYSLAVTSYQRALAAGTDIVPAKLIGEHLARIKAEHPQEFQKGLDEYITPRMALPPPGYGFPNGFFPGHPHGAPGPPGRPPGPPAPSPPPALAIPAVSPAASAVPSPSPSLTPRTP